MSSVTQIEQARLTIVRIARRMLAGEVTFIEGARAITSLRLDADVEYLDPDFIPFIAIDSETDTLPFGDVRKLWMPSALEKLQPEIERSEQWARDVALVPCQKLIDRFSTAASHDQT